MACSPTSGSQQLEEGYRPVPISENDKDCPLRLCVIARDASSPGTGIFVMVRDAPEATIYLGCLVDAGGCVHQWVELWIQNLNRIEASPRGRREMLTNSALDERWKRQAALLGRLDRSARIEIAAERSHPLPIYFDLAVTRPVSPANGSGPWELCTDDHALEAHSLPPYHSSLARYLAVAGAPPFVPVSADAPQNEATRPASEVFPDLLPLNADGGLMMVRKFAPLRFETYLGLLGGASWKEPDEGARSLRPAGVYGALSDDAAMEGGRAHLLLGRRGSAGRLTETFHLKLGLLAQAFGLVRDYAREEQLPFLNLSADSFRVSLAETGAGLPFLWTTRVSLAIPGAAEPLPGYPADERRCLAVEGEESIYRPSQRKAGIRGTGDVQITGINPEAEGGGVIEGLLLTQENLEASKGDLLWLRLPAPAGRMDFYATLTGQTAPGGHGFRTLAGKLDAYQEAALRSAEDGRIAAASFETLPLEGADIDLYSLAVLAVRTLLVNGETALPAALEALTEFARGIPPAETSESFRDSVQAAGADPRWADALGPHRLIEGGLATPEEARAYLPKELWWDTIAVLIQCFPGLVTKSFSPGLDENLPGPVESVFEPAIQALDRLFARSRSLLFSDWKYSAEVHAVLQSALKQRGDQTHGV